jgi:O-acetyl-ADP-ribose deacetylase
MLNQRLTWQKEEESFKALKVLIDHKFTVNVVCDDITTQMVDAVVNPANSRLSHGGGCAAVINQSWDRSFQHVSSQLVTFFGEVPSGHVTYQSATGQLASLGVKYVIHTVGPRWSNSQSIIEQQNTLFNAILNSLKGANKLGCASVAIPAISSGIFGFPKSLVA